jgi:ketosteroid isomerase-like protein
MRTTTEVFEDHLAKRLAGDIEEDIRDNYSEDVVFLTGTGAFKGHEGVRQSVSELQYYVGDTAYEYKHTLIEGDYAFLEWTARSKDKSVYDGADGFVIKDGKIVLQTIHYSVIKHVPAN